MTRSINLNADLGEGFGAYDIGDDAGMLDCVGAANIACGFHAGDPDVMRRALSQAQARGVSIGAHPGFADIQGFGRRRMTLTMAEVENLVAYQIGALCAVAALVGAVVTHVKPHGALSNIAAADRDVAQAVSRAIRAVDRNLIFLAIAGSQMEKAGRDHGLPIAREGFCDRQYGDDGHLVPRSIEGSVYREAAPAVRQVLQMLDGRLTARSGQVISCEIESLCIHGDEPTGVAIARAVRDALSEAGVQLVTLSQMLVR